jgi:hypothetical protein
MIEAEYRIGDVALALLCDGLRASKPLGKEIALDLRDSRARIAALEAENARLRWLVAGALFHFFCCGRANDCGQLDPAMADLAKAIQFKADRGTNEEIAAIAVSNAEQSRAHAALEQPASQPQEAGHGR